MYDLNKKMLKIIKLIIIFLVTAIFILIPNVSSVFLEELSSQSLTEPPKELNQDPSIATYNTNIHVVWNTYHNSSNSQIYYKKSENNGKNWGEIKKLFVDSTTATIPAIDVNEENVHVICKDFRFGNPEIFYIKSIDNGKTWISEKRLTFNNSRMTNIYDIDIKVIGENIYIIWKDYRSGSSEIFFKKSIDNGESWTDDIRLTNDYTPSYFPSMTAHQTNIFAVFEDGGTKPDLCFIKSADDGDNWSEKIYITDTNEASEKPDIFFFNNVIYVVWQDERKITHHPQIYFMKSYDFGNSWSSPIQISFNTSCARNPKIYVNDAQIYVLWLNEENGSFYICYKTSIDEGKTWNEQTMLTFYQDSNNLEIVGEEDNIHLIFELRQNSNYADIWHMGNWSFNIFISSLVLSKESVCPPCSVTITLDGFDTEYEKSDLTCLVQYLSPNKDWQDLNVSFNNNHWEADLTLHDFEEKSNYSIRARLINPEGSQTDWKLDSLLILSKNISNDSSEFEISSIILMLFLVIFLLKKGKGKNEK